MTDRIGTHGPDCYLWGRQHYECAMRKIDELRERLEWREDGYDGIYCRDQTIAVLERERDELRAQLAAIRK